MKGNAMKTRIFTALLLSVLLALSLVPVLSVSAASDVVYVKDGGSGDGSSADKAVGSFEAAYAALDLTKSCTIVVCGELNQVAVFDLMTSYTGSVTITSVYGGTDYRTSGAKISAAATRFLCYGTTEWNNVNIDLLGSFYLIVGQFNTVTVGEGVNITGSAAGFTGAKVGNAFTILGGYQSGAGLVTPVCDKNFKVTVLSGEKICLVAGNRQVAATTNSGKGEIYIGKDAKVSLLFISSVNVTGAMDGDITVTLADNASVDMFSGPVNLDQIGNSFTLNWLGGTINTASINDGSASLNLSGAITWTNGSTLNYTDSVSSAAGFDAIKTQFTKAELISAPAVTTVAPAAGTTAAPATTTAASGSTTPTTADNTVIIIAAVVLAAAAAAVVISKRKA